MEKPPAYRLFPSYRLVTTSLFFGAAFLMMANFTSMNFTITCMVNSTADSQSSINSSNKCGLNQSSSNHSAEGYNGHLAWSRSSQSIVLAGNAIGAFSSVFIAGYFTDKYGARYIGLLAAFLFAITALTMPIATKAGWQVVTAVRIIQGMGVMAGWPLYLVIATQWFPIKERGLLTAIGASGNQIGSIYGYLVASYCCKSSMGWPLFFYSLGGINLVFMLLWFVFYTDHVESAKFISKSEIDYILSYRENTGRHHETKNQSADCPNETKSIRPNRPTPWSHIARSPVIWSLLLVAFGAFYLFFFIADYMPTYYKESLGIDLSKSGFLSSLPSVLQFFGRISAGPIGDKLDRSLGKTTTIKLMSAISGYGPCVMLVASTAFDCHRPYGAVICLSVSYFLFGYAIAGFTRAAMMVAPGFAGTIAGMFQTANFAGALVAPYIAGAIIGHGSDTSWHRSFYVAAGFAAIGTTAFLIFGSGEALSWAKIQTSGPAGPENYTSTNKGKPTNIAHPYVASDFKGNNARDSENF